MKKKKCTYIWDGSNATNQDSVFPHLAVGLRLMDAPNSLVAWLIIYIYIYRNHSLIVECIIIHQKMIKLRLTFISELLSFHSFVVGLVIPTSSWKVAGDFCALLENACLGNRATWRRQSRKIWLGRLNTRVATTRTKQSHNTFLVHSTYR